MQSSSVWCGWSSEYDTENQLICLNKKTFNSIDNLAEEVRQMRLEILQNRAELLYIVLLLPKGGVFDLIISECCSFVSDNSENIESEAQKAVTMHVTISNGGLCD